MRKITLFRIAKASAGLVVINGTLAAVGYAMKLPALYHWPVGPESIAMAFPTALGFITVGVTLIALILLEERQKEKD